MNFVKPWKAKKISFNLRVIILHIFIYFLTVQLMMDDVSSKTCIVFIKNELQKHRVVHQSNIQLRAATYEGLVNNDNNNNNNMVMIMLMMMMMMMMMSSRGGGHQGQ